jgi:hypothetical protein
MKTPTTKPFSEMTLAEITKIPVTTIGPEEPKAKKAREARERDERARIAIEVKNRAAPLAELKAKTPAVTAAMAAAARFPNFPAVQAILEIRPLGGLVEFATMLLDGQDPRERRVLGGDELLKPALAFDERLGSQILAVPEQVKGRVVQPAAAREDGPKIHPTLLIQRDYLAVENRVPRVELGPDAEGQVRELAEHLPALR